MIFVQLYLLFGFVVYIHAYKTDTFPPVDIIYKHFKIDDIRKSCYERSGVDRQELVDFEMTEDFENLPNSRAIKVFFRCFGELMESLDTKTNKIYLGKASEFLADLPREQQEIYVRMARGCIKRVRRPITDLLDFAYEAAVCFKQNDNEHFYIFY